MIRDEQVRVELHRVLHEKRRIEDELSRSIWLLEQERDQLQIRFTEARRALLSLPPPTPLPPMQDSPEVVKK